MSKTTTLARIRAHSPCQEGWETLLKGLGKSRADDKPLAYSRILEINGLDDALWCARAEPQYPWRELAIIYAEGVRHLMTDQRLLDCLEVVRRHCQGLATDQELAAARAAASAATIAAARAAASAATIAAASAATIAAAGDAAWASAGAAAWASAGAASWAGALAGAASWAGALAGADSWARAAAGDAARAAARVTALSKQAEQFLKFVED